jgi:hypothetical protein
MLAWASTLVSRLGEAWTTLPCPGCHGSMTVKREAAIPGQPVTVERVYECRGCGRRVARHWLWAIPD